MNGGECLSDTNMPRAFLLSRQHRYIGAGRTRPFLAQWLIQMRPPEVAPGRYEIGVSHFNDDSYRCRAYRTVTAPAYRYVRATTLPPWNNYGRVHLYVSFKVIVKTLDDEGQTDHRTGGGELLVEWHNTRLDPWGHALAVARICCSRHTTV